MLRSLPVALAVPAMFLALAPASAADGGGGSIAPPAGSEPRVEPGAGGGAQLRPHARRGAERRPSGATAPGHRRHQLVGFSVSRSRLYLHGRPASVRFRIDGRSPLRDVRVYLTPRGARTPAGTIRLGAPAARAHHRGDAHRRDRRARPGPGRLHGPRGRTGLSQAPAAHPGRHELHARAGLPAPPLPHRRQLHLRRLRLALRVAAQRPHATRARTWPRPAAPRWWRRAPARSRRSSTRPAARGTTWSWTAATRTATTCSCTCSRARSTVREGQSVRTGQRIGAVGSSGASSGPHLHFEIWTGGGWYTGGHPIDPLPYLRAWPR